MNIDLAWHFLKEQCCVNPHTATKCVMVTKGQFEKAMENFKKTEDKRTIEDKLKEFQKELKIETK